jgi:hypothetical protein
MLLLDEFPSGLFGKGFGGAVAEGRVFVGLGEGDGVPVCFAVGVGGVVAFGGVQDGGEGTGYDDVFYGWGVRFDGAEDAGGADDGGVEEVFFGVGYVEVELEFG